MNITFESGYRTFILRDVDAKFVDKLMTAVRVEYDYELQTHYLAEADGYGDRIEVKIVSATPMTASAREELLRAKKAKKAADAAAEATECAQAQAA